MMTVIIPLVMNYICTKTSYLYMMMQIHISKHTFISIATIFKRFLDVGGYCGVAMYTTKV